MFSVPVQIFEKIGNKVLLVLRHRFKTLGALQGDESSLGEGMIGRGKKASKSHLLEPFHNLFKAFSCQLGCTLNAGNRFQDLSIGEIIETKIRFGNMNERFPLLIDGHFHPLLQ